MPDSMYTSDKVQMSAQPLPSRQHSSGNVFGDSDYQRLHNRNNTTGSGEQPGHVEPYTYGNVQTTAFPRPQPTYQQPGGDQGYSPYPPPVHTVTSAEAANGYTMPAQTHASFPVAKPTGTHGSSQV